MDRKGQLKNVSFGGAWSEQIAGNEAVAQAIRLVEEAVERTVDEDLRDDASLTAAIRILTAAHPKGKLLHDAWTRTLSASSPAFRTAELARIATALRAGLGSRLNGI